MSRVTYEWCCELVHIESGDRDDLNFYDTFDDALAHARSKPAAGYAYEIALWRNEWSQVDPSDLQGTEYAYLLSADGSDWQTGETLDGAHLPETFDCSDIRVPKRFHDKVAKAKEAA